MLRKIAEFFKGEQSGVDVDESGNPTSHDLQVATVVLMVEMASADHEVAPEEAEAVCNAVASQFSVDEEEIPELVQIAIAARQEAGKIDEFVGLINDNFNASQRQRILAMMWKVVLADGRIDKFEERFINQLVSRFQLSEDQAEAARSMAEQGVLD